MLFATLDPTTRKLNLPRVIRDKSGTATSPATSARSVLVVEEDGSSSFESDEAVATDAVVSSPAFTAGADTDSHTTTVLATAAMPPSSDIPEPIQFETYADCEVGKGQEIFLTDTVGFISKLPTDLIAAFRATLEEVKEADVLIHVCDRSSPVWRKQRRTVLKELAAIGCTDIPIVELWNKIDMMPNPVEVMLEASRVPVDIDAVFGTKSLTDDTAISTLLFPESSDVSDSAKSIRSDGSSATAPPTKQKTPTFLESKRNQAYSAYSKDKSAYNGRGRDTKRAPVEDNYFWSGEDDEYITQDAPVQYLTSEEDSADSINKASFTAAASSSSRQSSGQVLTVAASVKSGLGFNNFLLTLEKALTLKQETIAIFVPYDKDDGTVAQIFSQATIESVEYKDTGTYIICKVADNLLAKVSKFVVNEDVIFM